MCSFVSPRKEAGLAADNVGQSSVCVIRRGRRRITVGNENINYTLLLWYLLTYSFRFGFTRRWPRQRSCGLLFSFSWRLAF